jgi:hypothetical protein
VKETNPLFPEELIMSKFSLQRCAAAVFLAGMGFAAMPAQASSIPVVMTTSNGTVPGTSITYTIAITGDDGGPRNIFPSASSDNGVWSWTGGFPEFLSFGMPETVTVTFSAPVPIDDIVFGINSTSASTSQLQLTGGTATTSDFNLTDSLEVYTGPTGEASFDSSSGMIAAPGQNQSIMIGSTSSATIDSFSLAAGASDGGADGYTEFVGFAQPQIAPVPEPSPAGLLGAALALLLLVQPLWRRRRS